MGLHVRPKPNSVKSLRSESSRRAIIQPKSDPDGARKSTELHGLETAESRCSLAIGSAATLGGQTRLIWAHTVARLQTHATARFMALDRSTKPCRIYALIQVHAPVAQLDRAVGF